MPIFSKLSKFAIYLIMIAVVGYTQPAYSFDPEKFIDGVKKSANAAQKSFSFERMETDGSHVVLHKVKMANDSAKSSTLIAQLTLINPKQDGQYGVTMDGLTASDLSHTSIKNGQTRNLKAKFVELSEVFIPGTENQDNPFWPAKVGSLNLNGMEFSNGNRSRPAVIKSNGLRIEGISGTAPDVFSLKSLEMEPATGTIDADGNILNLSFEGFSLRDFEQFSDQGFDIGFVELGSLQILGKDKKGRDINLKFGGGSASNFYLADPSSEERPVLSEKPMAANINSFSVQLDNKEFMGWSNGVGNYTYNKASSTGAGSIAINDMFIDFSATPLDEGSRKGLEQLKALGYERLGLNLTGSGSWNPESGLLSVDQYKFEFIDAGTIDFAMQISGYTSQIARSFAKIARQAGLENEPQRAHQQNMQIITAAAQLVLQNMKISVTDSSLLQKVLALQAGQIGKEPQEIAGIVGPMASIMLAPYQIPEFAASLSSALGIFMQGNKTITATVNPQGGLPFTEILSLGTAVQTGQTSPKETIDRLNLHITAN